MANATDFKVKRGLVVSTTATILSTVNATSTTTGALIVAGGAGIAKDLLVTGTISALNSATTALVVRSNINMVSPDAASTITIRMLNSDAISFSGNSGQLFSITDSMTGTIFAVNDISGVPSIEVYDTGEVRLAETFGYVRIPNATSATSTATGALRVDGGVGIGGSLYVGGIVSANSFIGTLTGTVTTSTNLSGGATGSIPYQTAPGRTSFIGIGSIGQILQSNGTTATWVSTGSLIAGTAFTATTLLGGTAGQIHYQSAPGVTAFAGPGTAGQVLVSAGTSAPVYTNTASIYVGNSTRINTTAQPANATYYPTFVDANNASAASEILHTTSSFVINPSTGNVGFGVTPTVKLDVAGDIRLANNASYIYSVSTSGASTRMMGINGSNVAYMGPIDGSAVATFISVAASNLTTTLYTAAAERMRIDSVGNVGIGTISPASKLQIGSVGATGYSVSNGLAFGDGTRAGALNVDASGTTLYSSTNLIFSPGTSERMRIAGNGNVYINTTTQYSGSRLSINGGTYINGITTSTGAMVVNTTAAPLGKLYVVDSGTNQNTFSITRANSTGVGDWVAQQISYSGSWSTNPGAMALTIVTDTPVASTSSNTVGAYGVGFDGSGFFGVKGLYNGSYSASPMVFKVGTSVAYHTTPLTVVYTSQQSGSALSVNGGAFINGTVTATNFVGNITGTITGPATQVQTTAQPANATYFPTFVDANNASAAAESLFTTSSFVINPSTGFVGIGSASPAGILDVRSASTTSINSYLLNTVAYGTGIQASVFNLGKVESGTVQVMGSVSAFPTSNSNSTEGILTFGTRGTSVVSERLRIDNLGKVGIGTVSPASRLHVAGDARITGITTVTNNTAASSTITGAFQVVGGVGIGGNVYIGGNEFVAGTLQVNSTNANTATNTSNAFYTAGGAWIEKTLVVSGDTTFRGSVVFQGTNTFVYSSSTVYTDNLISLHAPVGSGPGNHTWTVDDGKDIGFMFHYYKGVDRDAFLGFDNDTQFLEWFSNGVESGGVFTGTTYGTFRTGGIRLVDGASNSGNTTTGALQVLGGAGISGGLFVGGTVTATSFVGAFTGSIVGAATQVNTVRQTSNAVYYPTFVDSNNVSAGGESVYTTSSFVINPSTGNVGIGTSSPASNLHIVTGSGGAGSIGKLSIGRIGTGPSSSIEAYREDGSYATSLILSTSVTGSDTNTERMRINSAGNVGIGTTSPGYRLQVAGTTYITGSFGDTNTEAAYRLKFYENGGTQNDTGIGVNGSGGSEVMWFNAISGFYFGYGTAGTKVTFDSTGKVGIGITSPASLLHVAGDARITGITTVTNATVATSTNTGAFQVVGGAGIGGALFVGGSVNITSGVVSTNTGTGALIVNGGVGINGALNAITKSFNIGHPTKPGMSLRYGSLEGPEFGVYVRGRLTDSNVIELPEYWSKLVNPDSITVNLTPVGSHQKLYVEEVVGAERIVVGNENLFGKTIDCYYTVYAERADIDPLVVEG